MRIYIPQKITITVKNRLHSRQQPCRSPRQTVIGIGLRELFCQKVRLPFSEVRHYRKCRFSKMPHSCAKAHTVYTQVCLANLQLNGARYFSVPFKLGLSGSAAVPLPRVPPFYVSMRFFSKYPFPVRLSRRSIKSIG